MKTESTELKIDVSLNQEMLKGLVVSAIRQKIEHLNKSETSQDASIFIQDAGDEIDKIRAGLKAIIEADSYGSLADRGIKWGKQHNVGDVRNRIQEYLRNNGEIEDYCQEVVEAFDALRNIRKTLANTDTQKLEDVISIFNEEI